MTYKSNYLQAAALEYASYGWHVFPIAPGTRKAHKSAAHSGGSRWGATTDPDEIERDWSRWPDANVGICTGPESNIFVIDVDSARGHGVDGFAGLHRLITSHDSLPATNEGQTPTDGRHYYFAWPHDMEIRNSAGRVAPGIDVRGEGGMVIAPPSIKPGVGRYLWLNPPPLFEPVPAPEWLLDLCRYRPPQPLSRQAMPGSKPSFIGDPVATIQRQVDKVRHAPAGARNEALNRAAFICAKTSAPDRLVTGMLADAARDAGLTEQEIIATINSGLRAGNGGHDGAW